MKVKIVMTSLLIVLLVLVVQKDVFGEEDNLKCSTFEEEEIVREISYNASVKVYVIFIPFFPVKTVDFFKAVRLKEVKIGKERAICIYVNLPNKRHSLEGRIISRTHDGHELVNIKYRVKGELKNLRLEISPDGRMIASRGEEPSSIDYSSSDVAMIKGMFAFFNYLRQGPFDKGYKMGFPFNKGELHVAEVKATKIDKERTSFKIIVAPFNLIGDDSKEDDIEEEFLYEGGNYFKDDDFKPSGERGDETLKGISVLVEKGEIKEAKITFKKLAILSVRVKVVRASK